MDEWDTGAEQSEANQDKFNKFDPMAAIDGPPASADIIRGADKPVIEPVSFEAEKIASSLNKVNFNSNTTSSSSSNSKPATSTIPSPTSASTNNNNNNNKPTKTAPAIPTVTIPTAPPPPKVKGGDDDISAPRTFSTRMDTGPNKNAEAFTEKLSAEALAYFNDVCNRPFSQQAVAFLNAYWTEVGSQAEFIFSCAWEKMKEADMRAKGINYIHLYDEGDSLEFNIGLYFYEQLCKEVLESPGGKKWRDDPKYNPSMPQMMTALVRKQELREKVDVNFDGKVSFIEYLLYQYRAYANPADFTFRSMAIGTENEAVRKARLALEEVNKAIRAYETEKQRLTDESKLQGVKGLAAVNLLAQLLSSPLAEKLNAALITAEAAVRIAGRKFGATGSVFTTATDQRVAKPTDGAMWWMSRELADAKIKYGKKG
jgi:hypothetical protein